MNRGPLPIPGVFFTLILFANVQIFANATLPLKERKKNFEQKLKFLNEMKSKFSDRELNENISDLENHSKDVESVFKSGTEKEKKMAISVAELKTNPALKKCSEHLQSAARELIEYYAFKSSGKSVASVNGHDNPVRDSIESKEKKARYFAMAKEELQQAEKFKRDGNLFYSLYLYKRSVRYSLKSIQSSGFPVPAKVEGFLKLTK